MDLQNTISSPMMDKGAYIDFCNGNPVIPIFMRPYWLDAVCGEGNWTAILSRSETGDIVGAWALHKTKQRGLDALVLPPMTPYTGIYLSVDEGLPLQKRNFQRQEILEDLIRKLPDVPIFEQKVRFDLADWAPFYWAGYRQETRYTFRFNDPDVQRIHANFTKSFRRNLRAAEREFEIGTPADIDLLYKLVERVYDIREDRILFDKDTLHRVFAALSSRGQCRTYLASDDRGPNSVIFCVWDYDTMYYLLGGRIGTNTKSSTNLLIWRAIQDAHASGLHFDFEGSMIKGVHRFFQGFGAEMVPYMYLYKYSGVAKLKYLTR